VLDDVTFSKTWAPVFKSYHKTPQPLLKLIQLKVDNARGMAIAIKI
jgi:hypothetical protein